MATRLSLIDEISFMNWYEPIARKWGINENPDAPEHFYDFRAAFLGGANPDATGHWPSKFKKPGHPNYFIDGIDTTKPHNEPQDDLLTRIYKKRF